MKPLRTCCTLLVGLGLALSAQTAPAQDAEYHFELLDNFGILWLADATDGDAPCTGVGTTVSGVIENGYPAGGAVSGWVCKTPRELEVTATNNQSDGCEAYSDAFTYTGTAIGPNHWAGDWTSYCGQDEIGTGTWTAKAVKNFKGDVPPMNRLTFIGGSPIAGRGLSANKQRIGAGTADELVANYTLDQNFPNPFNPTTVIAYELPEAGPVSVRVFNAVGQEVAVLADGFREAGRHEVRFDASTLSAGVYLYVLEAGAHQSMRQMVLLK